jgi:hypothetical protein
MLHWSNVWPGAVWPADPFAARAGMQAANSEILTTLSQPRTLFLGSVDGTFLGVSLVVNLVVKPVADFAIKDLRPGNFFVEPGAWSKTAFEPRIPQCNRSLFYALRRSSIKMLIQSGFAEPRRGLHVSSGRSVGLK